MGRKLVPYFSKGFKAALAGCCRGWRQHPPFNSYFEGEKKGNNCKNWAKGFARVKTHGLPRLDWHISTTKWHIFNVINWRIFRFSCACHIRPLGEKSGKSIYQQIKIKFMIVLPNCTKQIVKRLDLNKMFIWHKMFILWLTILCQKKMLNVLVTY